MAKSFTDNYTTSFPKMGDGIPHSVCNLSRGSENTHSVPRQTMGRGASPTGVKKNRGSSLKGESAAPAFRPVARLYGQNAAEASMTQRRTYIIKSAAGGGDFDSRRSYKQGV